MNGLEFDRFQRNWPKKAVIIPLARALKAWYRPRVRGLEQVPMDRPVVYVGKHPRTWLYFEIMLLALLTFWDSGRVPFRPMEKRGTSLHRLPILSWIRRNTSSIEATEAAALAALRGGESVLMFPGGGRELYGDPDVLEWRGRRGFARIAAGAGVPVVPFAIAGADQQHPLRIPLGKRGSVWFPPLPLPVPLDFWFGPPMEPPRAADTAAVSAFADRVACATQALLDEAIGARRRTWGLR